MWFNWAHSIWLVWPNWGRNKFGLGRSTHSELEWYTHCMYSARATVCLCHHVCAYASDKINIRFAFHAEFAYATPYRIPNAHAEWKPFYAAHSKTESTRHWPTQKSHTFAFRGWLHHRVVFWNSSARARLGHAPMYANHMFDLRQCPWS